MIIYSLHAEHECISRIQPLKSAWGGYISEFVFVDRVSYRHVYCPVIRHSRLPAGNALWFCQKFYFINFFIYFFFFRRQGFRMITFDRQTGPLQNFNRSHVMAIGRSVSFSDPARPPGGGVGCPKHPKIPPQEHFRKKKFSREIFFF